MKRRQIVQYAGATVASLATPHLRAQATPVRLLVGYPAGSTVDISARLLADQLRELLGRPVVVENRVGAASRLALEALKSSRPDGSTLAITAHGPVTLFPHLYGNLRYDPSKDFTPISKISTVDYAISAGVLSRAKTLAEFRDWATKNPDRASYGTPGAGSVPHFVGVVLSQKGGIPWTHVPYRGSPPAVADVIGGQLSAVVSPVFDVLDKHKGNRLAILATTGTKRSALLPEVPRLEELGTDLRITGWIGLYGPSGLSVSQVDALNRATATALSSSLLVEKFATAGFQVDASTPENLLKLQREESRMWGPIVKTSGFTPTN